MPNSINKNDSISLFENWWNLHNFMFHVKLTKAEFCQLMNFENYRDFGKQLFNNPKANILTLLSQLRESSKNPINQSAILVEILDYESTIENIIVLFMNANWLGVNCDIKDDADFYVNASDEAKQLVIDMYTSNPLNLEFILSKKDNQLFFDLAWEAMTFEQRLENINLDTALFSLSDLKFEPFFEKFKQAYEYGQIKLFYHQPNESFKACLIEGLDRDFIDFSYVCKTYFDIFLKKDKYSEDSILPYLWLFDGTNNPDISEAKFHLLNKKKILPKNSDAAAMKIDLAPSFDEFIISNGSQKADILFYHLLTMLYKGNITIERLVASLYVFKSLNKTKYYEFVDHLITVLTSGKAPNDCNDPLLIILLLKRHFKNKNLNDYKLVLEHGYNAGLYNLLFNEFKELFNKKIDQAGCEFLIEAHKVWLIKITREDFYRLDAEQKKLFLYTMMNFKMPFSEHLKLDKKDIVTYKMMMAEKHHSLRANSKDLQNEYLTLPVFNQQRLGLNMCKNFISLFHELDPEINKNMIKEIPLMDINDSAGISALRMALSKSLDDNSRYRKDDGTQYPVGFLKLLIYFNITIEDLFTIEHKYIDTFTLHKDNILFIAGSIYPQVFYSEILKHKVDRVIYLGTFDIKRDWMQSRINYSNNYNEPNKSTPLDIVFKNTAPYAEESFKQEAIDLVKTVNFETEDMLKGLIIEKLPEIKTLGFKI